MLRYIHNYLNEIESRGDINSPIEAYQALRKLGLNDFGCVLWKLPLEEFPKLSRLLPEMTAIEVQKQWTGYTEEVLLDQSVSFVRSASENFALLTGDTLQGKRILDYGCGYGRFLRLFRYYTDEVWGVDAWEESLALSRAAGFGPYLRKIDTVPESLPSEITFDFAFAFSIFTHLNARAATAALAAIRGAASPGAVLCITIRPFEYWNGRFRKPGRNQPALREKMRNLHNDKGFAFAPSGNHESDPEGVYGHATMDTEWLQRVAAGWDIVSMDRSTNDGMQRYIFLKAV